MRWLTSRRWATAAVVVSITSVGALVAANDPSRPTGPLPQGPPQPISAPARPGQARRAGPIPAHKASSPEVASPGSSVDQRLTLSQLAGQRIIYAYAGLTPPRSLLRRIRDGEAAGVIFFGSNIANGAQLRAVIGDLQRANASSPVHAPLLMLIDQEGGLVRRLPGPPTLSEKAIGASSHPASVAADSGRQAGANLIGIGITVNLAPVLDVFRTTGDFIDQYQRSYGDSPRVVAQLGYSFITALQHDGVAATAKHFPGLGAAAASQNTDNGPVTLDVPLDEIRRIDEAPYREAVSAGVKLVMLSWAIYPALDPRRPAGLSPIVVNDELRQRLGFRGVTITDAIGAGALRAFGSPTRRGVLAAAAGADLLICSAANESDNTPSEGVAVLNGLEMAFATHRFSRRRAEQAAARVIALRSRP